jgi:two-component system, LuxR family, sensor kinase FixL
MKQFIKRAEGWVKPPDFNDPDKNLSAHYLQMIALIGVFFSLIIFIMYFLYGELTFLVFHAAAVFVYVLVIVLIRLKRLQLASHLFLLISLFLLTMGILAAGGIHASSALVFPILLVYASLLVERKPYILYCILCIASIACIIYAENRHLIPIYSPDPPELPLFLVYAMIMIATGVIVRLIAESLQSNLRKTRQYAQELSIQKTMLDRVGQAVVSCTIDNTIIYWNRAATDLYGWTVENAVGRKYYDVVPTELTSETADEIRTALRAGQVWSGVLNVQNKDRNTIHALCTITPLRNENGAITGWIGIAADLTERRRIELELYRREVILEAVTFAAQQFLTTSNWRENIDVVLERLGKTINATHAYLFEDHLNAQGEPVTSMRNEWTAPGYTSDLGGPYFQNSPIHQDGFEEQVEKMGQGEVRFGTSFTFNAVERQVMQELGVKSVLEVPVFVNGREWGAIGFDDFENEREWSFAEVDALKIAAGVLSAVIQRQEAESAVRDSERIYRQAIEAADAVPYYQDYASNGYLFMGQGIYEMTGYRAEEMNPQVWLDIVQETVMLGEAAGLSVNVAVQLVREGKLKSWQCDQKILTRDGRVRWLTDRSIEIIAGEKSSRGAIGILQDITDRKATEAGLRKRESVLEAITFSAEQFLRTPQWREGIDVVLERLGGEFNSSHAYLFENTSGPDGSVLHSMRYEWTASGQRPDLHDPSYQNMPNNEEKFVRYYQTLNRGEPFVGSHANFTAEERAHFNGIGIKAILELRIMVDGRAWGVIGFDDMLNEREWTDMEVDVIKVAANVLGAAIKRQMDEDALQNELTERKKTEQALILSEEKFFQAFHATPVLMTLEDADGRFIEVNNAFVECTGYSREEVAGHRPAEFNLITLPDDRERIARELRGEKGVLKEVELRIRKKTGEFVTVLMSVEYVHTKDTRYILTSALDITERKLAEQRYQDIFNNSIDGIFQSTEDGKFINVNPAMARIYGYDSPEDMLRSVNDISTQVYVDIEQRNEAHRRLNAGEKLTGYEVQDYRKDGSRFWSSMSAQAIRDGNGNVLYYEGTIEDVTRRKKAEAERETLIQELAAKNLELGQFTYTVSHDLKSPLVTINGFLGYLEQDAFSGNHERLKKDIQRIQEAVHKMQRLLNELLELSRIGRMMNPPEDIPFVDLVDEAMKIVYGRLDERKVTVHTQPNLPVVSGDKPRLIEVLQNLLDNAAKYMGAQSNPHIEIGQRGKQDGKPVFFVSDNGIGIAPEYHERVFGLFNKLDATSEGTGVGLTIVKRIIEVHGGRIWVESEAGKGSTFLFTLSPSGPLLSQPKTDSVI